MDITIFTPTYNRADLLERLYNSLKEQTNKKFMWLIVDDGSTDNTETLVKRWIEEDLVSISYHKQKNQGKSMAHNKGVELTNTELFVCVDSDDYLESNAIEQLISNWNNSNKSYTGILCFRRNIKDTNKNPQEKFMQKNIKQTKLRDAYELHSLVGDTMLTFRTDILKKYKFPKFEGEFFIPEAYLYDLIDQEGELLVLNQYLYNCEYQEGGYTNNMAKLLKNNPKGYFEYINQRLKLEKKIKYRFMDSVRYVAMGIAQNKKDIIRVAVYPGLAMLAYPMGYMLYLKRYK